MTSPEIAPRAWFMTSMSREEGAPKLYPVSLVRVWVDMEASIRNLEESVTVTQDDDRIQGDTK